MIPSTKAAEKLNKTETMQTQTTGVDPEEAGFASKRATNDVLAGQAKQPSYDVDNFFDSTKYNNGQTQEELSMEQSRSEMDYEYESEEYDYKASKESQSVGKVKDIVDPNDPEAILLQTDTKTLYLSKLPVLLPSKNESSRERIFHIDSLSSISNDSLSLTHTLVSLESQHGDFFENLGDVPNIDDISSSSEMLTVKRTPNIRKISHADGQFVNPLTGSSFPLEVEEEKAESIIHETESLENEERTTEDELETDESLFEDFDDRYPEDPEGMVKPTEIDEGDILDTFVIKHQFEDGTEFFAFNAEKEEELRQKEILQVQVDEFLNELLNEVVHYVYNYESQTVFKESLDRKTLFKEIEAITHKLIVEQRTRDFLDHKAADYYRRRQLTRYITPEKPERRLYEYEKFREASQNLDHLLGQEVAIAEKTNLKIAELHRLRNRIEKSERNEKENYKNTVRKTLKRDGMPHLDEIVEQNLRKMDELADQITETRLAVIQRQHTIATLKAKIEELENIGDGLRVAGYERIQAQNIAVSKKVEERSRDLGRFHDRFNSSLHILAHSKLKNEVLKRGITIQVKKLETFVQEKANCRSVVVELKRQHQKIKRQINDLSHQNGLIDKPTLLRDYDDTVERMERKRNGVEELRLTYKKLQSKLQQLEKACSTQ